MKITTSGTQKESKVVDITTVKKNPVLHYDLEYDSMKPEQTIRDFVSNIKGMVSRFESNKARIIEIENELLDVYHYIEISTYKKVPDGYKLYRKMAELRRERRACKNENDLLQPIYEYFHATEVLNKLSHVQGECAKCMEAIDNRTYTVRTDILDEWLEPQGTTVRVVTEEEPAGINLNEPFWDTSLPYGEEIQKMIDCPTNPEIEPMDDPETLKAPGKTEKKPMSAFKQVWKAAF